MTKAFNSGGASSTPAYPSAVKVARRTSAVVVNLWLVTCLVLQEWWLPAYVRDAEVNLSVSAVPTWNLALAVGVLWYAFLSQLKIRWALVLPVYLLFFPIYKTFCLATRPAIRSLQAVFDPASTTEKKRLPLKRIWLLLFFTWIVAFRGLDIAWASWILPALAVPIWLGLLGVAYKASVAPITFVKMLLELSSGLLDTYMSSLREPKPSPATEATFVYRVASSIMQRYSSERVTAVIHREAIAVFSVSLLAAVLASACFWGLVARALMRTSATFPVSYQFFTTGSWFEAVVWAFGCMTTTVAMPGLGAAVWVKALHVLVLLTGIFQFTYLLACFSIMASAEASRVAGEANRLLQVAESKMQESKELEIVRLQVTTITTAGEPAAK